MAELLAALWLCVVIESCYLTLYIYIYICIYMYVLIALLDLPRRRGRDHEVDVVGPPVGSFASQDFDMLICYELYVLARIATFVCASSAEVLWKFCGSSVETVILPCTIRASFVLPEDSSDPHHIQNPSPHPPHVYSTT